MSSISYYIDPRFYEAEAKRCVMDTQMEIDRELGREQEEPHITALVPAYNRAHLLPRAINSILDQTFAPYEIIVVDDGSTDNTKAVVDGFGDRVRYIFQENAGPAVARHHGITVAQTEWVAMLDSDDIWNPDHLERMSNAIVATGGRANFYFSNTRRTKRDDGIMQWQLADLSFNKPYMFLEKGSDWVLKQWQPMMLQSTVLKRSAYLASGGFHAPLRYREDTHLFIKLGLNGPVCAVAGGGARMTDDDLPHNRLSINHGQIKSGMEMSVLMYQELLDYFEGQLTPEQEDILSLRLANDYLNMARISWRKRDFRPFVRYLILSGKTRPRAIIDLLGRKAPFVTGVIN